MGSNHPEYSAWGITSLQLMALQKNGLGRFGKEAIHLPFQDWERSTYTLMLPSLPQTSALFCMSHPTSPQGIINFILCVHNVTFSDFTWILLCHIPPPSTIHSLQLRLQIVLSNSLCIFCLSAAQGASAGLPLPAGDWPHRLQVSL